MSQLQISIYPMPCQQPPCWMLKKMSLDECRPVAARFSSSQFFPLLLRGVPVSAAANPAWVVTVMAALFFIQVMNNTFCCVLVVFFPSPPEEKEETTYAEEGCIRKPSESSRLP